MPARGPSSWAPDLSCTRPPCPPSAGRQALPGSRTSPPPRVRSAPRGGGAQIPVSGAGGGGGRQCALRRSPKRTRLALPLPLSPVRSFWSLDSPGVSSPLRRAVPSTPPPFSSLGRVGSDCPRGGGGGSGCRPRLTAPGSVPADPGEEVPPPPPLPPSRCPRAGLGRAAMPSDFISLLSADLDLESPKSLYSRDSLKLHPSQTFHRAGLLEESVYDLLPKELQLPPPRETSVASMSQTSGGEAGSPPPAVVAAGFASEAGSVCIKNDL